MTVLRFNGEASALDGALEVLEASGERRKLSETDRREMLARIRAGEHVEISFATRGFYQGPQPNRNNIRIKNSALGKLAKSFTGQPFLRDHGQKTLEDRGGKIVKSELVKLGENEVAIDMTVLAVTPWAATGLLDGTIDRFSIGFMPTGPVICSVHKTPLLKDCACWPGDKAGDDTVQAIFTAADGVELSAVNVPAVPEAQGVEIRAAFSALAGQMEREQIVARKDQPMDRISTHLGLGSGATEDQILAALKKLADDKAAAESRLAAEVAAHGLVKGRLAEVEAERLAAEGRATAAKVDGVIEGLYRDGKLPIARDTIGERVPHPLETHLRDMVARLGYEAFAGYAASLPKIAPVGSPLQLARDVKQPAGLDILSNPVVRKAALAGGVTEADIIKFNGLGVLAPAEGSV